MITPVALGGGRRDTAAMSKADADRLLAHVASYGSAAVAFSGGVDSLVVACAAVRAFGDAAVAVTGVGPALATREREDAKRTAAEIGIHHVEVTPDELSDAGYVANAGDRCYFCKQSLYRVSRSLLESLGVETLLNGTNADDTGDYRPGLRAAAEAGVRSPLLECGFGKAAVRGIARAWGLAAAEKPASPCLASRIAPGVSVTAERLRRIDAAEECVRELLGVFEFRVRLEAGELARIEVPADCLSQAVSHSTELVRELRGLGFRRVTLDLAGFESGNLNMLVPLCRKAETTAGG